MALTSWKSFEFFDVSLVKLEKEENSIFADQANIGCVATGSDSIFFGSSDGVVRILNQGFKVIRTFRAYDAGSITHMKQIQGTSLLVTIAEDLSSEPLLKVWALDKLEKKTGSPRCQSQLSIHNGRKPFPISAFAALDDLSQLAIGFGNGSVTVIRGDLIHDRGAKQRTVFESEEPVTGIAFREGNITTLYIATTGRISTLVISGRGQGQPARTLEEQGCGVGCMTVDRATNDVVVAREDGLYYYGLHGRGTVYTYDVPKQMVGIFKEYITLVSPPRPEGLTQSTSLRAFGARQADDMFGASTFTILNTDLKFIAHQNGLSSQAKAVFQEWGDLFILTLDGKIHRLHEKSFQQKLEDLYRRHLYVLAINLAQRSGIDPIQQNVIYRKYGDYLYQRQDYDTAMQQYLKAIDNTEPSQVIRKFLDTQRIHNLVDYLEELHDHHKATPDHTILLLNCYAKLKDVKKLEEFIKSPGDLKFDLDTAISMCRQGGYYDQAAYLARKHNEHELVVDILIEDCKRYAEAMAYIWRLEPSIAYENVMKYATVLLEHCPEEATQLFIDYYTGNFRPKKDAVVVVQAPTSQGGFARATTAVQNLAAMIPLPYMSAGSTGTTPAANGDAKETITQVVETTSDDPPPEYDIPKPRTAFSAFVDHPTEFITFLEACTDALSIQNSERADLYTTLFEMYLQTASTKKDASVRQEWENKAKSLIEQKKVPLELDSSSNVLLVSHLSNFRTGTILVREKQGLRSDIFRSYTSAKDTAGAIKALHKYGPEEPQLYPAALQYLTSDPKVLEEAGTEELDAILKRIDDDGLMAPLQVIQTLSTSDVATMGMIKKYLQQTIDRERQEIANNRRLIQTYSRDTTQKKSEIQSLTSKPTAFNATRCSSCGLPLDLPTVHFLCKHSFHAKCLNITPQYGESEEDAASRAECPLCGPNNSNIKAILEAQEKSAERHDLFKMELARSSDRFGTVGEWFGRGAMSAKDITQ